MSQKKMKMTKKRKKVRRKLVRLLETWQHCQMGIRTANEIMNLIDKEYKCRKKL